jgi:glutathione synthase/RimK-type ligase-like ATP-grasp enzyme
VGAREVRDVRDWDLCLDAYVSAGDVVGQRALETGEKRETRENLARVLAAAPCVLPAEISPVAQTRF